LCLLRWLCSVDIGGKALTNYLKEVVTHRQWNVMDDSHMVNQVKEALCYVAQDFTSELRQCQRDSSVSVVAAARAEGRYSGVMREFVLPDFHTVMRGYVRDAPVVPPSAATAAAAAAAAATAVSAGAGTRADDAVGGSSSAAAAATTAVGDARRGGAAGAGGRAGDDGDEGDGDGDGDGDGGDGLRSRNGGEGRAGAKAAKAKGKGKGSKRRSRGDDNSDNDDDMEDYDDDSGASDEEDDGDFGCVQGDGGGAVATGPRHEQRALHNPRGADAPRGPWRVAVRRRGGHSTGRGGVPC
jgi:hypothetical protein